MSELHKKSTFAVMFGNRGFFPASLQSQARTDVGEALDRMGHEVLMLPPDATPHGAIETPADGACFANLLREHRGKVDGVIISLPNFGDETGAIEAVCDAGLPIFIQAYPDELDRMSPEQRRDAFCGKFSIMDVLCQHQVPFTIRPPHTVHPRHEDFVANIEYFDRLCRTVRGLKRMRLGAIGARTTPFKTVRIDELALERHGITVETMDLATVIDRVHKLDISDKAVTQKASRLEAMTCWGDVPQAARDNLAKLGVVLDRIIEEMALDAFAIRCWLELQEQLSISPCVLLGETNQRGVPGACEVDLGSAVTMYALQCASGRPAACLDWNNNYGDDPNRCILFHCGPIPPDLMAGPGQIADHSILATVVGKGCSYGCNTGRIAPGEFTYGGLMTENGRLKYYLGEARFTNDPIADDYFGCAGVAAFDDLQSVLMQIGQAGHRHHVTVASGHVLAPMAEALERYLGSEVLRV
jgi:L-fucose isomerase-like protein